MSERHEIIDQLVLLGKPELVKRVRLFIEKLEADSKLLDKLIASGRLRYALAADRQVGLTHRRAVDEVLEHTDKRGDLPDGWWEELEPTTEEVFWREHLS